MRIHGGGEEPVLAKKEEENLRSAHYLDTGVRPKRYRESVNEQGQEDLDTNRGVAGRKTGRGGLPRQGRGQREYSHHA